MKSNSKINLNIRAVAARILFDVIENGYSLADSLPSQAEKYADPRDRALLQALCYGVCRWYFCLDNIAQQLLDNPLKSKDQDIYALILVGLYQLIDMRIPEYAVLAETVAATKDFNKIWAKGLVNAVLREYLRREGSFCLDDDSHPEWMLEKFKKTYPDTWEEIVIANNQHPPLALRVNQQRIQREKYLEKLSAAGIPAEIISETKAGIVLENPMDVQQLPGFSDGEVSVQDGAAQLAAELLMLEPNQRVLDACAAPGGKTGHILEQQPTVTCIAIDQDKTRLQTVKENLQRLHLSAECAAHDVAKVSQWWDGQLFDRILLDAPCSASGVIRRHPDIKLLRRESDIFKLAETQSRLLNALWDILKPGGILLYATCSVFPEENTDIIEKFLSEHSEAKEEIIQEPWGIACSRGKQILPGMHGLDGFYFARLRK